MLRCMAPTLHGLAVRAPGIVICGFHDLLLELSEVVIERLGFVHILVYHRLCTRHVLLQQIHDGELLDVCNARLTDVSNAVFFTSGHAAPDWSVASPNIAIMAHPLTVSGS